MTSRSKGETIPTISRRGFGIFAASIVVLSGVWWLFFGWYQGVVETKTRHDVQLQLVPYEQNLETQLNRRYARLTGLTAFARAHASLTGIDREFQNYASGLLAGSQGIRHINIAPGGVVTYVYPLEGNAAVIGRDITQDPRAEVRRDVADTIAKKTMTVRGPYDLVVGGQGMIAREAIFETDGRLKALTTLVFSLDQLAQDAGLASTTGNLTLAVRPFGERALIGSDTVFKRNPEVRIIDIPGGQWELGGLPKSGWGNTIAEQIRGLKYVGALMVLLLATLITGALDRQFFLGRRVVETNQELRRKNEDLNRLNRLYTVLTAVNKAIVKIPDPQSLFDEVCRIAVEKGGFSMSWIGMLDENDQSVVPVAMAGHSDGDLDGVNISSPDMPEGGGPTGMSIRENRSVVSSEIANDPNMEPWRDKAQKLGFKSCGAFPIRGGGKAIGALMVYDSQVEAFGSEERRLLDEIANDVSFALEKLTQARELEHAASFPKRNPSPIVEFDSEGGLLFHNKAATDALESAGLAGEYTRFQPDDYASIAVKLERNPDVPSHYREVTVGDRVYGETISRTAEGQRMLRIYTMDITDKKRFESELVERQDQLMKSYKDLDRMVTMYSVLSEINEKTLRLTDRKRLSRAVCATLYKQAGYDWVGVMLQDKKTGWLKTYAWEGKTADVAAFLDGYMDSAAPGTILDEMMDTKEHVLCLDIAAEEQGAPWREMAARAGFEIFGAFPLITGGQAIGAIVAFSGDPGL